jgi:energy-coupling factor transporter ATP-binding protein EcfA2
MGSSVWRRIRLPFASGVEVEFADRRRALEQVVEWSERGTRFPIVIFGPEGCGKSSLLKQGAEILRDHGFDVIYVDPLHRDFMAYTDVGDIVRRLVEATGEAVGVAQLKLATLAIDLARELLGRWRKRRIAVLVDEVFQAVGVDLAEVYVKSLLNLIEHPPGGYENIVVVVATSEGLTRFRIGRHMWSIQRPIWNMSREGFEELYRVTRGGRPSLDQLWALTGGNPRMLSQLYQAGWDEEEVITHLARGRRLGDFIGSLNDMEVGWLEEALEDPDTLVKARERRQLKEKLVELNLIVDGIEGREEWYWVDTPPPSRDPELGIGYYVAWQTPIHREAVRRTLLGRHGG